MALYRSANQSLLGLIPCMAYCILSATHADLVNAGFVPDADVHLLRSQFLSALLADSVPGSLAGAFAEAVPERELQGAYSLAHIWNWTDSTTDWTKGISSEYVIAKWSCGTQCSRWFCYFFGFAVVFDSSQVNPRQLWSSGDFVDVFHPQVEFHELTGKSPSELLVQGTIGLSANWGGAILTCDSGVIRDITPRDTTDSELELSELFGNHWETRKVPGTNQEELLLYDAVPGSERDRRVPTVRSIVRYSPSSRSMVLVPADSSNLGR